MSRHLKKISEEILHENPWWTYKHDKYEKPNGEIGDYFYGDTPGMSLIVPALPDGRLVLTSQHRYLQDKQSIEFPGGGIKKGQKPLEAAKSELLEETGFSVSNISEVGVFYDLKGLFKHESHVFLAYVTNQVTQHLDDTEDIDIIYRTPEDFEKMIKNNEIWDAETMAAWTLVRDHFIKN